MTEGEHERVMRGMADVVSRHDWDRLGDVIHEDAVFEYPQSGERFRGLANIRAQFENYPDMGPGTSQLAEVFGDDTYALTPSYTVIRVEGTGLKGTAVIRIRYPDDTDWFAINLYEVRDGRISRSRSYFAPDFEAPDWRAPYREAP
jgi:ketosteroid isomerase-like protein